MKKAILIYFTGTGNTKLLAESIKNRFYLENLYDVDLFEINIDTKVIDLKDYDLIIFSYPIYAFNTPIIFDKYIKKLKLLNKKYLIIKQSGEPLKLNNTSSYKLRKWIKKNNGELLEEYHFLYPYNIHFKYPDNLVKELYILNNKLMDILIYELKNNIKNTTKLNYFYILNSKLFKIQRLGGPINSLFYRVDKNKCINCNLCINNCPTHNIELKNKKIKFHLKCIMCMRCSFSCPTDAINIGMLQSWKVNGAYDYDKIIKNDNLDGKFIENNQTRFYKLFNKKIKNIEELHNFYFKK